MAAPKNPCDTTMPTARYAHSSAIRSAAPSMAPAPSAKPLSQASWASQISKVLYGRTAHDRVPKTTAAKAADMTYMRNFFCINIVMVVERLKVSNGSRIPSTAFSAAGIRQAPVPGRLYQCTLKAPKTPCPRPRAAHARIPPCAAFPHTATPLWEIPIGALKLMDRRPFGAAQYGAAFGLHGTVPAWAGVVYGAGLSQRGMVPPLEARHVAGPRPGYAVLPLGSTLPPGPMGPGSIRRRRFRQPIGWRYDAVNRRHGMVPAIAGTVLPNYCPAVVRHQPIGWRHGSTGQCTTKTGYCRGHGAIWVRCRRLAGGKGRPIGRPPVPSGKRRTAEAVPIGTTNFRGAELRRPLPPVLRRPWPPAVRRPYRRTSRDWCGTGCRRDVRRGTGECAALRTGRIADLERGIREAIRVQNGSWGQHS